MTQNQINYAKHLESARSNRAQEDLSKQKLQVDLGNLEVARQNAETNARNATTNENSLLISARSVEVASQQAANVAAANAEAARHNAAMELETARANDLSYATKEHATSATIRGQDVTASTQKRAQNVGVVGKLMDIGGGLVKGLIALGSG